MITFVRRIIGASHLTSIRTPSYKLEPVPHLHSITSTSGHVPLGVTVLHTPGHTPDELALWDAQESTLYVGDTLYKDEPIIFPEEGSLPTWVSTIDKLLSFVRKHPNASQIKINCGHATVMKPAIDVLEATRRFMEDVISGREPLKGKYQRQGIWIVEYNCLYWSVFVEMSREASFRSEKPYFNLSHINAESR